MALQDDVLKALFGSPLASLKQVSKADAERARAETQRVLTADYVAVGAFAGLAVGGTAAAAAGAGAGGGVLAALTTGVSVKEVLKAAGVVMGTSTFVNFIGEEAMQTAGMACFVAKGSGNAKALRVALDNYKMVYEAAKRQAAVTSWATPFAKATFDANLVATASAIDAYEATVVQLKAAGEKKTVKEQAAADLKAQARTAKQYEANALDAMNAGDLKVGQQWLDKIADDKLRAAALKRVVKAATKTRKAAVADALKLTDVETARSVAALIPDDAEREIAVGKINTFEALVDEKAAAARVKQERKLVVAANKVKQQKQRDAYYASLPKEQQAARQAQVAAAAKASEGAWEGALGAVYYSGATGKYTVSGKGGVVTTYSATDAAAYARQAGGKTTVGGLTA